MQGQGITHWRDGHFILIGLEQPRQNFGDFGAGFVGLSCEHLVVRIAQRHGVAVGHFTRNRKAQHAVHGVLGQQDPLKFAMVHDGYMQLQLHVRGRIGALFNDGW